MSEKKYYKYSLESLKNALEAIKHGMPCSAAAKTYGVPRTTLIGKINGTYPEECQSGVSTILTSEEENILVEWIINMGRMGFPITKLQLIDSVSLLVKNLKRPNKFTNGRPGRHWYEGFLRRHPQISQRMAQNLTASRAVISQKSIQNWFDEINNYFASSNINIQDPERIFNADESAFFLSPKGNSVLTKKGSKTVYDRSGNDKECLTVLITGSAAGHLAPPMIMYPYERIPKHIVMQVPEGWGVGKSESGWMTSESFFEYISNIFYPYVIAMKIKFPIILYVDGHKSHITLPLSNFCREKQIILISLLPNSTHILQPLDVGLFKSLKNSWKKVIRNYRSQNKFKALKRETFAPVLKAALEEITKMEEILANAFKVCGLCPFDSRNVDYTKVLQSIENFENMSDQQEDSEVVQHLRFLEQHIEKNTLEKFYSLKDAEWDGNNEDKTLYIVWKKVFKKSGLTFGTEIKATSYGTIETEDSLNIEEGWEDLTINYAQDVDNINLTSEYNTPSSVNIPDKENADDIQIGWENNINNMEVIFEQPEDCTVSANQLNSKEQYSNICILQDIGILPERNDLENKTIGDVNVISKKTADVETKIQEMFSQKSELEESLDITYISGRTSVKKDKDDTINKDIAEENSKRKDIAEDNLTQISIEKNVQIDSEFRIKETEGKQEVAEDNTKQVSPDNGPKIHIPGLVIPSPFKKALFWPEQPGTSKKPLKKGKEKIPSVTTSDAWKQYYLKREEERDMQNKEKNNRKQQREEKKNAIKEIVKKRKRKCDDKENKGESTSNQKCDKSKLKVNDFVIVNYEGEYYPGTIKDLSVGKAFISTMTLSGLDKWKWSEVEDEIWYELHEIMEKINPPKKINKRGCFEVEEMQKYSKFLITN